LRVLSAWSKKDSRGALLAEMTEKTDKTKGSHPGLSGIFFSVAPMTEGIPNNHFLSVTAK
jgi:hypothetical protein